MPAVTVFSAEKTRYSGAFIGRHSFSKQKTLPHIRRKRFDGAIFYQLSEGSSGSLSATVVCAAVEGASVAAVA